MGKGFATFSVFVTIGFLSTVGMAADRHAPLYSSRNVGAPTLEPHATLGNESHKQGAYFGYPDEDSLFVVTTGVDRGAAAISGDIHVRTGRDQL